MPKKKILLAASGGGHVRQLLDLEPFWRAHDTVFATEPTPLGASIAEKTRTRTFAHFAFGQSKVAGWGSLIRGGLANLWDSLRIIASERPDVVISSGAGSAFFCALFGRLSGAEIVVIESFARFHAPSLFGKLAGPLATRKVVQSPALATAWPDAEVCDPFQIVDAPRPPKQPLAFVTVGTVMPFNRMVHGVAALKAAGLLPERVVAQVGEGGERPKGLECTDGMRFDDIQALLQEADLVFTHGGTGSLVTALRAGCRVIAMPRDPDQKEHYDDHQREIVEAFAERGLIQACTDTAELPAALAAARAMTVRQATTNPAKLIALLQGWYPV
ncbi:beta-1,4-glucuronosyltransferase WelK [Sandaracinobacteroides saxicola]|uniref:Glycosyl transferase family 28 n=1 Tax=Sandaracinobacteroides saxicola TaxID=2759707 RepID=A0A7G5IFN4_9SPHN|nr:glycosyltransferase [Sandaracinobacteroides saxicola]QMW22176.1 glycosyl transferase family 28 [Sandaracinobacteroides saxicola]